MDQIKSLDAMFCPNCGESFQKKNSLVNSFWNGEEIAYFCWCSKCNWRGEIVEVKKVTAYELSS